MDVTDISPPTEPFLTAEMASVYLKDTWGIQRTAQSLATYRCRGGGPAYKKAGRYVLYARADLDLYAHAMLSGTPQLTGRAAWQGKEKPAPILDPG